MTTLNLSEQLALMVGAQAKLGRLITICGEELNGKITEDAQKFALTAQQVSDYQAAREVEKAALLTELVAMMQGYLAGLP